MQISGPSSSANNIISAVRKHVCTNERDPTNDLRRGHANKADCDDDIRVRLLHGKHESASWYIGAEQVVMNVFRVDLFIIDRQNHVALVKIARVVCWASCTASRGGDT